MRQFRVVSTRAGAALSVPLVGAATVPALQAGRAKKRQRLVKKRTVTVSVMSSRDRQLLVKPIEGYFESARWHRGELWFSDFRNLTVNRVSPEGVMITEATVASRPSGIGFESDGTPLVVTIDDCKLWRLSGGPPVELADFGAVAFGTHDMAVDASGRAYVSEWGYDVWGGAAATPTGILVRHPNGEVERFGSDLVLPNGIAISADGGTLVVAETFAEPRARLTAFTVLPDGGLAEQRVFAEFGPPESEGPDGLCIDAEGGVWVAFPGLGQFRRVVAGGEVTDVIEIPAAEGNYCVDCALGGAEMRTLHMLIAETDGERLADNYDALSRVEAIEVSVPGA
jgi:sugar lactone lactonase YvrE